MPKLNDEDDILKVIIMCFSNSPYALEFVYIMMKSACKKSFKRLASKIDLNQYGNMVKRIGKDNFQQVLTNYQQRISTVESDSFQEIQNIFNGLASEYDSEED